VAFLNALLLSLRTLGELGYQVSCRAVATICIESSDEVQLSEFRGIMETVVEQSKPGQDWRKSREHLLWLRDWQTSSQLGKDGQKRDYHGVFWRVSRVAMEIEILKALLAVEGINARQAGPYAVTDCVQNIDFRRVSSHRRLLL
jgi:protein transport protein SEC39